MAPDPDGTSASMEPEAMVFTVLGCGTLVPDAQRASACYHVECGRLSLLLDCGSGALHGLARHEVEWEALTHVAITHFHNDHLGDLPAVLIALKYGLSSAREEPLVLIGPTGFGLHLSGLVTAIDMDFLDQSFPLDIVELGPGERYTYGSVGLALEAHDTEHTDESVAYRVETATGTMAYTGDTGPSETLGDRLAGVDLLLAECSHADPPPMDWHLTPSGAAALAKEVGPELLVLTHVYAPMTPAEAVRDVEAEYDGRVVAAAAGLVARIRDGSVTVDLPGRRG